MSPIGNENGELKPVYQEALARANVLVFLSY